MSNRRYVPKRGVFEATLACNLRCKHCGSRAGKARDDELSTEECADLFQQLAKLGTEWITISGGEPMARPDWADLIGLARGAGLRVGMITNGIDMDDEAAELAKSNGLNGVGLSVDGLERTHDKIRGRIGHFNRLMEVMDTCRGIKLPFSVVTHINRDNLDELEAVCSLVEAKGAYAWQVQLGSNMGNMRDNQDMLISPKQLPMLEKRLAAMIKSSEMGVYPADSLGYFGPNEKKLRSAYDGKCFGGCGAGMRNIGIESNGNIKGCLSIMAGYNEEGADYVEGNIRHSSLEEIWNRPGAFAYNRNWSVDDLEGFCKTCGYVEKCRGGCIGKRISDGDIKENHLCVYRVLVETGCESRKSAQAAAVVLAGLLGASTVGCHTVDEYGVPDTETSTDPADTDTSTDTADTESDSEWPTDIALYAIIPDTDSTVDTSNVDEYGVPDTDVLEYGIPDTEADSDTTAIDTEAVDTENIDLYGVPLYDMVSEEEEK